MNSPLWNQAQYLTMGAAIVLVLISFKEFVLSLIGNHRIRASEFMNNWLSTSNTFGVTNAKKAASCKLNGLLLNAHSLHPAAQADEKGNFQQKADRAMFNYVVTGAKTENVATFLWTFKMILSRKLFNTEGIWIT